jgi:hypothetical protein
MYRYLALQPAKIPPPVVLADRMMGVKKWEGPEMARGGGVARYDWEPETYLQLKKKAQWGLVIKANNSIVLVMRRNQSRILGYRGNG